MDRASPPDFRQLPIGRIDNLLHFVSGSVADLDPVHSDVARSANPAFIEFLARPWTGWLPVGSPGNEDKDRAREVRPDPLPLSGIRRTEVSRDRASMGLVLGPIRFHGNRKLGVERDNLSLHFGS